MTALDAAALPTTRATARPWVDHTTVALTVVVALEALRRFFPGVYGVSERSGVATTAALVILVVALPLATPLLRRAAGGSVATWAVLALAAWRLVASFGTGSGLLGSERSGSTLVGSVAFGAAGTVLALVALTTVLGAATPGRAWAVVGGLAIDLTVTASFSSLDPVWPHGGLAAATGVALAGALGWAAWARHHAAAPRHAAGGAGLGGGIAVGAVLALELLFLANPAFVAAVDVSYSEAVALVALGLLAMAAGVAMVGALGRRATLVAAAALVVVGWWLPHAHSASAVVVVLVAQVAAGAVLGDALDVAGSTGAVRGQVGLALGWWPLVVGTLLYQLHYDTPLPVDNRWLAALTGALAALAALSRPAPHPVPDTVPARSLVRWSASVAALTVVAGVVVPAALAATAPAQVTTPSAAAAAGLRVVQWNVHQAVDGGGALDGDAVAEALAAQAPFDVVVLNEVARGWPLSGQVDLATWLSRRLDLPFVWAGVASSGFGNVVLSRLPILRTETLTLPVNGRAQGRSALHVTLDRGGRTVDLVATHLQHRNDPASMTVRLAEIRLLLERFGSLDALVLAGDLNPRQGDPPAYPSRVPGSFEEVRALLDAGLTTAADLTSCSQPTSNRNCSDYVFVGGSLVARAQRVVPVERFDHALVVADVV